MAAIADRPAGWRETLTQPGPDRFNQASRRFHRPTGSPDSPSRHWKTLR